MADTDDYILLQDKEYYCQYQIRREQRPSDYPIEKCYERAKSTNPELSDLYYTYVNEKIWNSYYDSNKKYYLNRDNKNIYLLSFDKSLECNGTGEDILDSIEFK